MTDSVKPGPHQAKKARLPYLPPHALPGRLTLAHSLPDGVRRAESRMGDRYHEFRQADGAWLRCGGKGRCRECLKEESMKTTMTRLREALEQHFGYAYLKSLADGALLFETAANDQTGRALGDALDRVEMLICIEAEFGIELPDEVVDGDITLADIDRSISQILAAKMAR